MTEASTDILDDLRYPTGVPCAIVRLRTGRPELGPSWDRVIAARLADEKAGRVSTYTDKAIADWFSERGWPLDYQVVSRHRRGVCVRCRTSSTT